MTFAALFAPIGQAAEQKLTASNGASFNSDMFGQAVAISGDTAIVGAPFDNVGASRQGSASVFVRSGGVWTEGQKLTASDGAASDGFGWSVAISGDTAIVGAYGHAVGANVDQGSAYVFVRTGGVWTERQKLTASDGATADLFGWSVAISGDTAVVAAWSDAVGPNVGQGSAYIFVRSGGVWMQDQKLTAADGTSSDQFGYAVAISGDTVIVGATGDAVGPNGFQGSAYVFIRSGIWTQEQKLTAADGADGDRFGQAVAISGDTAIVGASGHAVGPNVSQGSAYVFVRGGVWTQERKLTAGDGAPFDEFGRSVAISGDIAILGASSDAVGANGFQGSAYVFLRSGGVWTQDQKLTAADGAAFDQFGYSVALSGGSAIVGAPFDDDGGNGDRKGSAYVFELAAVPAIVALSPPAGVNDVGRSHTVAATVTDVDAQPVADVVVRFSVIGSVSASGSCTTGSNGQCSFGYAGPSLPGADAISAYADTDGDGVRDADEPTGEATMAWVLPSSTPGQASGGGNVVVGGNRIAFGFGTRSSDNAFNGNCNVVDHAADVIVRCSDVTTFVISGNTATVFGSATVNGVATTYRIDAVDNADPGKGVDTFSIQTGTGYRRSGVLTGGNVEVN